jgi:hypothetical protein
MASRSDIQSLATIVTTIMWPSVSQRNDRVSKRATLATPYRTVKAKSSR